MALAFMMPPKGKAAAEVTPQPEKNETLDSHASQTAPPHLTGSWDFSRLFKVEADPEIVGDAVKSAQKIQHLTKDAWRMTVKVAGHMNPKSADPASATPALAIAGATAVPAFTPKPMTHEEIRLWLQSFNAGPYACLKYEGNVPYQETRNYVPRVMKYYEEVKETEYDEHIEASAKKYGLDPQMIRAIMKTESSFNNETVSPAGARGLMQVMPVVWKDIKEKYDLEWEYSGGVFEPEKNIEVACAYLAWLRYDFLPRHFDAYESDPAAPVVLVRDKDRGVPDRESPRIVVSAMDSTPSAVEVASVQVPAEKKSSEKSDNDSGNTSDKASKSEIAESTNKVKSDDKKSDDNKVSRSKVEISDVGESKSAGGKTKVVMRGGSGKAISISVNGKGKVTAHSKSKEHPKVASVSVDSDNDRDNVRKAKHKSVAKANHKSENTQGG